MITNRLKALASYLDNDDFVLDIGTDHAYLPIYLMENSIVKFVYASEVNKGPFNNGLLNIKKNNLESKIKLFLTNGLKKIPKDYNCITISGMGSSLILDILSFSDLGNVNKLVLQSNTNMHKIREKLSDFIISDEIFVKENNVIYEIIVFKRGIKNNFTSKELYFGPINLKKKDILFFEKYNEVLVKKESQLNQIPKNHQNYQKFENLIKDLKEVLEK